MNLTFPPQGQRSTIAAPICAAVPHVIGRFRHRVIMARTRTDFTDDQRAELFRLDCATCSYSGRNLWILDYGMDPSYAIDWADHIVPASKGGPSEIENGATASWFHNYLRGDAQNRLYLFHRGQPTASFLWHYGPLPDATCRNLQRFARLHTSDWFLNRGLWHQVFRRRARMATSRDSYVRAREGDREGADVGQRPAPLHRDRSGRPWSKTRSY